ncbi:unnamed protein product [Symbiodinium sp. CCMP2592]|nr:unnamed protein product [Symbiodinium sp. CCMP2592]
MPADMKPWTPHMQGVGLPKSQRVLEVLDLFAWQALLQRTTASVALRMSFADKKTMLQDAYVDVSQNPKFCSVNSPGKPVGCLTTSTILYSYGRDRVLIPQEYMLLQGHRRGYKLPASGNQVRQLAGEGICLPVLGVVIWAMYLVKGLP